MPAASLSFAAPSAARTPPGDYNHRAVSRKSKQAEPKVTAHEARTRGFEADGYAAYFWCLVAADFGDIDAGTRLVALFETHQVGLEDITLAHYQLGCWYAAGEHVVRDARRGRSHLAAALGAIPLRLDADLLKAITQVREHFGIPFYVDLNYPLGPAMPGTPGNVHRAQLDIPPSAPLLRPFPSPDPSPASAIVTEPPDASPTARSARAAATAETPAQIQADSAIDDLGGR